MYKLRFATLSAGILFPLSALANDGFIMNALDSSQNISIFDNGKQICALAPGEGCKWAMTLGTHRVEIFAQSGASIFREFSVPDAMPSVVIDDSAFRKRQATQLDDLADGAVIP